MKTIPRSYPKIAGLSLALWLGAFATANADLINITVDATGALRNGVGVATKNEYGLGNNNPTSNLDFLNAEIGFYNAAFNPDLPVAVAPVEASFENLNSNSYTSIGGYDYLVIHYGAGQAAFAEAPVWVPDIYVPPVYNKQGKMTKAGYTITGHFSAPQWDKSTGGWWQAYYIDGLAGIVFSVPVPGPTYDDLVYNGLPVGGFSSARYFNIHETVQVPEAGMTLSLLGGTILAMLGTARRLRRRNA